MISKSDAANTLQLSRRKVLNVAASGALVLALGTPVFAFAGRGDAPILGQGDVDLLNLLDESLAQAFVGNDFDISSDTANAKLRLSKVEANTMSLKKAQGARLQSFAMEFEVLSNAGVVQQDTYHVMHPKLGAFDLLLVPHTNGKGRKVLIATFSRLK